MGPRTRPDLPPGTDLLPQIQHIVVLMMENHSYDNYLGLLAGRGDGLPLGPDGARGGNLLPNGRSFHAASPDFDRAGRGQPDPDLARQPPAVRRQRLNDGFAASVAATVPGGDPAVPMGYWTEQDLPFYYGLARTFPLADRWFCSCLGPTFPNRRFLIAGTAHGLIDDLPWDVIDYPRGRDDLRPADHDTHLVGQLPPRPAGPGAAQAAVRRAVLPGRARRLARVGRWVPAGC